MSGIQGKLNQALSTACHMTVSYIFGKAGGHDEDEEGNKWKETRSGETLD